jgi:hypothetical protein
MAVNVNLRINTNYGGLAMSEKERKEARKVTRRNFLRGAGIIVGGAASLGIGGLALTGCDNNMSCRASGETDYTRAAAQVDVEYFGECVCPDCDARVPHPRGVPCRTISCPRCGTLMARGAI